MRGIVEGKTVLTVIRIDRHHAAAGAGHAQHLLQAGFGIVEMLEDALGAYGVEARIGERQRVDARDLELDSHVRRRCGALRRGDHRFRRIDARDPAPRPHPSCELDADLAAATSDIEHGGAPLQPEQFVTCASNAREAIGEHREVVDEFVGPRAVVYI